MIQLSLIIVSYNTKDILQECLTSVFQSSEDFTKEVIVVDNASHDGSIEMVEKEFPQVTLIQNKENLGFSKANNIGVKQSKGEYVLFLNSDTVVTKNVFAEMVSFMEKHTDAGAATCRVELRNGELDDAAHRGFPTPWNAFCYFFGLTRLFPHIKFFSGYTIGWENMAAIHRIDVLAGAFMIVRRTAGEEVGWWDEDYFWYGEDIDFCFTLKEKKWQIYYVPTVSILHYKGVSGGIKSHSKNLATADSATKKRATKARFEAMKIFYKKHYTNRYPWFVTWFVYKGIAVKQFVSSL